MPSGLGDSSTASGRVFLMSRRPVLGREIRHQRCPFLSCSLLPDYRSEAKKTKVKKKTNNPQFDEVFYFEVGVSVT